MLNRRTLALAALLSVLGLPLPLAAQEPNENDFALECRFDRECREAEPCTATGFTLAVDGRGGGMGAGVKLARVVLYSAAGKVDAFGTLGGDTLFLQGGNDAVRSYLVVTDGAARYTLHMAQGPQVVSYLGTCE
ncbi:hypothetical protein [Rhodovulum strictum]|uniref:Uncharacterized protein n=1 Tax=Rhodovulum strictum TaxID=58314 RepID=A0A844B7H0_9RHOB|nr:hypothetical protein [Rhodovulum strictum]MRH22326.1 hypothetical protein [Rhodovulum strictum]